MRRLFFIDVDGTVADNDHRVYLIRGPKPNWDEFFKPEHIMRDAPILPALKHFNDGRFIHGECVFLTARIESTRDVTKQWLIEHGFATQDTRIICKPDVIRLQRSRIFKPSVLDTMRRYDYPNRDFVLIEDYGEVRRSTEEAGYTVLHAPNCWEDGSL